MNQISTNTLFVRESPLAYWEVEQPTLTIVFPGVSTITNDATLVMKVYRGNDDVTSSLTTGSLSVLNNTVTLKTLQNLVGGDHLIVTLQATCDGTLQATGVEIFVRRMSGQ